MSEHEKSIERQNILITQIGEAVSQVFERENPDQLMDKLQELASLQSTATYCLANAKKLHNRKVAELLVSGLYDKYSSTDRKLIFLELASIEVYQLNLVERLVANISHSIDSLRSILSFMKMEREQSKFQTT